MRRRKAEFMWVIGLIFIFIVAGVNNSVAGTPGVTDTTIKIGASLPMSGPGAMWGERIGMGLRLAVIDLNERGGVYGRKVELIIEDDQYRPALQVANLKKLLYKDEIFIMGMAINCVPLFPLVERERVPLVTGSVAISMAIPPKRYVFPIAAVGDIDGQLAVEYIMKDLKAKNPKVAILYQDNEVGHDGLKSSREGLKTYGLKPVAEEIIKPGSIDFITQIINLKRVKPDYVILATVPREEATFLMQAKKMGLNTNFIGVAIAIDDSVIELAGDSAEGLIGFSPFLSTYAGTPGANKYLHLREKYQPKVKPSLFHMVIYGGGLVIEEVLKRAGKDLTREGFVEAFETIKDFTTGVMVPLTFGKNDRTGARSCYPFKADVSKKRFVLIDNKPRKITKP